MNKKLIAIIAAIVAVLIIVAVVISANKVEPAGKDMDISAGTEENIIEDDEKITDISEEDEEDFLDSSNSDTSNENESNVTDKSKSNDKNKQTEQKVDLEGTGNAVGNTDYEKFHAMSPQKQQEYMESFGSMDKFFNWYNKAKKQYEKENPGIDIDGGSVELE